MREEKGHEGHEGHEQSNDGAHKPYIVRYSKLIVRHYPENVTHSPTLAPSGAIRGSTTVWSLLEAHKTCGLNTKRHDKIAAEKAQHVEINFLHYHKSLATINCVHT